ncbi:hypothetical protein [Streptomyces sp. DSM 15324]|uniref:hypothetical protein n=1 Tax=Streptomyces sp. DSM 15324 TaxID=1739111 RepID=UPI00074A317E|nr:hypothetical protein [Streptomyces sp. DSM 15324]KUO06860.1 hypothetical protein AQJ58_38520 [Streptomyces sp. DSM 15324]
MQEHEQPEEVEVLSGPGGEEREPGSPGARAWRRSARGRAVIAATAVAVLALGGTVAYAATSGGSSGSPSASPSAPASSSPSEGPGGGHGRGGPWSGFWFGGDAAHGEATVKDRDTGKWVVHVWQRGTVEKVDGDRVTVKSEDGTSWTWTVGADAAVHTGGTSDSGASALKKGDTVVVVGSRSGDTYTAARVVSGDFSGFRGRGPDRDDGHDGHDGFRHGPWNHGGDDTSPGPTGSRAAT